MTDWSVAVIQNGKRDVARDSLKSQGFGYYFPEFLEKRVCRGRRVEAPTPLFGSYAFVELSRRWRSLLGTRGIARIFMSGDEPARVRESVIDEIKSREIGGYVIVKPREKIRVNDRVVVTRGLFASQVGVYQGMKNLSREIALVSFLGLSKVELSAGDLELV